jgi:16S rRNA processing protein RimM
LDAIVVARLRNAHGLDGEILASIDTGDPDSIFVPGREFELAGSPAGSPIRSLTLETARPHKGGYLLRFREIGDREAADALRGREITLPADALRPLEENEFFLHDLVGLEAWREGGDRIGAVIEVYDLGGQILLGVDVEGQERLVPFRPEMVRSVDHESGRVWIDPPPGLLEL